MELNINQRAIAVLAQLANELAKKSGTWRVDSVVCNYDSAKCEIWIEKIVNNIAVEDYEKILEIDLNTWVAEIIAKSLGVYFQEKAEHMKKEVENG